MSNLDTVMIRYVGEGRGTIPGVPARDMTNDEAREYDIPALLRSGLYELERPKRSYTRKVEKEPEEAPQDDGDKDGE